MRRTHALVQVAMALLDGDGRGARQWGYDLGKRARVRSGVLYPILQRLLDEGWLSDGWETEDEAIGRPPRRYYELTDLGRRELGGVIEETRTDDRFAALFHWREAGRA